MNRKLILKSTRFVPFGGNLTLFQSKSDTPVMTLTCTGTDKGQEGLEGRIGGRHVYHLLEILRTHKFNIHTYSPCLAYQSRCCSMCGGLGKSWNLFKLYILLLILFVLFHSHSFEYNATYLYKNLML